MNWPDKFKKAVNRPPVDAIGIDCSKKTTHVTRMKRGGAKIEMVCAEALPTPENLFLSHDDLPEEISPLALPARLCGRFAAVTTPSHLSDIKLLRVNDSFDPENQEDVLTRMALEKGNKRISTAEIIPATSKLEGRFIAAVMPEALAVSLLRLFPAAGVPAPRVVSWSELAVINAFSCDPLVSGEQKPIGLIHFDHDFSLIALLNEGLLSQIRIFPFGVSSVLDAIMRALNVDQSTAEGVFMDGAFDISHLIQADFREILSQLVVSRDYMERSENCTLEHVYMSGPASLTNSFSALAPLGGHVSDWNVLEPYATADAVAVASDLVHEPWQLAAAIGSCLSVFSAS